MRRELEAIPDEKERDERVRELTAAAERNAKALNAATLFELDDVVDPADTRRLVASTLAAAPPPEAADSPGRRFVDAW
jgi:acetyl-CoA carboxylase carboxyltransferase component